MRISLVNPYYDTVAATSLEVTGRYRHVEALAHALVQRGHEITVIQSLHEDRTEVRSGVRFRYVRMPLLSAYSLSGSPLGTGLLLQRRFSSLVQALPESCPNAVHVNGITLLAPLVPVSKWCSQNAVPITVSHHGGTPSRLPWLRAAHRRALRNCRTFFTTESHAEPWIQSGVLTSSQVVACMEVSSTFAPTDRQLARSRTGMHGTPLFVWNAGLHKRKDPITALRGFSLIRKRWTGARLYMIYISNEMEQEVRETIATDSHLSEGVEMCGFVPPAAVEDFLNSADFIIQSSLSEYSGYSILEAMACGVIPIVSDIPSFRTMTDGGRHGVLFPTGNHDLLADRMLQFDLSQTASFSRAVREHFVQALSYEAMAEIYEAVLQNLP